MHMHEATSPMPVNDSISHGLTPLPRAATLSELRRRRTNEDQSSPATEIGTPRSYVRRVQAFTERTSEDHLSTGLHYGPVFKFLSPPGSHLYADPIGRFDHVFCHEWTAGNKRAKLTTFGTGDEPLALERMAATHTPDSGRLVFIRGLTSDRHLIPFCRASSIDPEFVRRHLSFRQTYDLFDFSPLPSASRDIFTLKIVTICVRPVPIGSDEIRDLRKKEEKRVGDHHRRHMHTVGESVVRRYSVHDETHFTIEQDIVVTVKKRDGKKGWDAFAWSDIGRDLSNGDGPWLEPFRDPHPQDPCIPIIRYQKDQALYCPSQTSDPARQPSISVGSSRCRPMHQNASLLPAQYGSRLNSKLAANDPLYALSELFEWSASSESQFLNMMQKQVAKSAQFTGSKMEASLNNINHKKSKDDQAPYLMSLESLTHSKSLLDDDHIPYLESIVAFLKNRQLCDWRGNSEFEGNNHGLSLLVDFETLLSTAQRLSKNCLQGTEMIINHANLIEVRKSLEQAENTAKLSKFASFYLPFTLTTSFFGMNFQQLGSGGLDIWWLAPVLAPLTLFSLAYFGWRGLANFFLDCIRCFR